MDKTGHLTAAEIEKYGAGTLSVPDLLAADSHMETCGKCREVLARVESISAVNVLAALGDELVAHVSFDQIAAYADGLLDEVDREIATQHFSICASCEQQAADLVQLRAELAAMPAEPGRVVLPVRETKQSGLWFLRLPGLAFSAAVLLIVCGVAAIFIYRNNVNEREVAEIKTPSVQTAAPPVDEPSPLTMPTPAVTPEQIKPAVSVNDGGTQIEIDANGKVSGIDDPDQQRLIANALMGKQLNVAPEVRQFRQSTGALMGAGTNGVPFALVSPIGRIVETEQPKVQWKPLPNAGKYRVEVYDVNFERVALSPELTGTEWKVNVPLKRGGEYRWQVIAEVNGHEVRSPVRPAPDAIFKVVDTSTARRLTDARRHHPQSHLLLGLLYAEAGLMPDAERELQIVAKQNPNSPAIKSLLAKVRAAR